jgi:nitrous oxide reductase
MANTGEFLVRVPRRTFLGTLGAIAAAGATNGLEGGGAVASAEQEAKSPAKVAGWRFPTVLGGHSRAGLGPGAAVAV